MTARCVPAGATEWQRIEAAAELLEVEPPRLLSALAAAGLGLAGELPYVLERAERLKLVCDEWIVACKAEKRQRIAAEKRLVKLEAEHKARVEALNSAREAELQARWHTCGGSPPGRVEAENAACIARRGETE